MIQHLALLLLPGCAVAVQEIPLQDAVQRELRIYPVASLVGSGGWYYDVPSMREMTFSGSVTDGFGRFFVAQPRLPLLRVLAGRVGNTAFPDPGLIQLTPSGNFASLQEIEELAARFCEPALDPAQERIQAESQGYLLAYLRPEQHEWLSRFLDLQQDGARQWLADVEARLYSVPAGVLARMDLSGSATLLEDAGAIEGMTAELERRSAISLNAPRVTLLPGQRGDLSVLNEVSYVKEYELHVVEPGNSEILDPVVDVIQEGHVLSIRALEVSDGLYGLEIESVSVEIERPIPTRMIRLSPLREQEVEIGLPEVRTAKVNATVRLADGGGVLLVASGLAAERDLAIVLSFHRAPLPAPEAESLTETEEPEERGR
jgi:hypothetical protein